jgi:hypothetical protein
MLLQRSIHFIQVHEEAQKYRSAVIDACPQLEILDSKFTHRHPVVAFSLSFSQM